MSLAEYGTVAAVIIISSEVEWEAVISLLPEIEHHPSPFGRWFLHHIRASERDIATVIFQGGWGKISAAASTQYVIDRWKPPLLVNLGTCGGFEGCTERGEILLVDRTAVYDIVEQTTDPEAALAFYTTELDLSWLVKPPPLAVRRTLVVSGDRDLIPSEVPGLKAKFGAVAGDWESGSIAWVAARNGVRCLILKGVSDLVGERGGDIYDGNISAYENGTTTVMKKLVDALPAWLAVTFAEKTSGDLASP